MSLLKILIVLSYFIAILLKVNYKYKAFIIILLVKMLFVLKLLSGKFRILALNETVLNFSLYIALVTMGLSFSLLLISFLITANFRILYLFKSISFIGSKLIDIKIFFVIMFFVFLEEIYFRVFTLPLFIYFTNNEFNSIIITSIIFALYHVDKVKYTNQIIYFIKLFDLFIFSIILSVMFILINNFWIIFFAHFFRNIVLTSVSIKSLSKSIEAKAN